MISSDHNPITSDSQIQFHDQESLINSSKPIFNQKACAYLFDRSNYN